MGIHHKNGYSAQVEGYFVVNGERIQIAKSNEREIYIVEPRDLPPGVKGDLLVIVDGSSHSRRVVLPNGMRADEQRVAYQEVAPF